MTTDDDGRMPQYLREALLFEATYRSQPGETKAAQVRARFNLSAYSYRRILALAVEHPEAERVAPGLVARARAAASSSGRPVAMPQRANGSVRSA